MLRKNTKEKPVDNDARKLSRAELLEMLVDVTRDNEALKEENKRLSDELENCKADLEKAASLHVLLDRLDEMVNGKRLRW